MKITKRQLRRIIREAINEAEFYDETPEGQLVGTEKEDARFTKQLDAERIMKSAGLTKNEIAQMWPFLDGTLDPWDFMETSMYEKLFDWYTSEAGPEDRMPYSVAKARSDVPDEWIIDRLAA